MLALGALVTVLGCAASPTRVSSPPTPDLRETAAERELVVNAMREELTRSMTRLKLADYEAPYFLAYRVTDSEQFVIEGRLGAIQSNLSERARSAYVELRVGSYGFDNHANVEAYSTASGQLGSNRLAIEPNAGAIRGALWLLTDDAYKEALSLYLAKRGNAVYQAAKDREVPSFSREESHQYRGARQVLKLDRDHWQGLVREMTETLRKDEVILDGNMRVDARREVRYFVNSEGADIVEESVLYAIHIYALARAEDGTLLSHGRSWHVRGDSPLPVREEIERETRRMREELAALRTAPVIDPYTGPAILEGEAAGVLFHEALGHRLEGQRQHGEHEGQTFRGQIGKPVLPGFLSVYDDPTLETLAGTPLNGTYAYDDEGVPGQRVPLVDKGVLRHFLLGRAPIEGFAQSNGHGRAESVARPVARMANLVVEADSEHRVTRERLKAMLLEEVRRQKKPFGLIIRDMSGGSTDTASGGYQAFKGTPRLMYRVDPETGAETLVRGVELVGTPLSTLNRIVAASDRIHVFNGICGAESGWVPVSASAPAILTTELELQRMAASRQPDLILPAPWRDSPAP